ncbi:hypothetical protein [Pseudomonas sp. P108]|uniref:hypothetical protein n=1 Tax=Pseudomonas sp. P108 TaxID=1837993 RepID=UPI001357E7CE|nr:hypothetical protein [Pseudomonas sp. P108]WNZ86615.1 hypothetical protein QOM10_11875 [Pseudomonas sp. P108]
MDTSIFANGQIQLTLLPYTRIRTNGRPGVASPAVKDPALFPKISSPNPHETFTSRPGSNIAVLFLFCDSH